MLALLHALTAFAPPAGVCNIAPTDPQYAAYTKNATAAIPGPAIVNLDLDPEQRWAELVTPAAPQIKAMIDAFKAEGGAITEALFALLEKAFDGDAKNLLAAMPQPYAGEIAGIEAATNISALDLFVVNIMYEVSGACTSIVAQDASGRILHGRNLDFGKGAALTTTMRPTLRHLDFQRGARRSSSTAFLGPSAASPASSPAPSRYPSTRASGRTAASCRRVDQVAVGDRPQRPLPLVHDARRDGGDADYAAAAARFNTTVLLGPAYVIAAGVAAGEGAVFTRSAKESLHYRSLAGELAAGRPYVLETNYDWWTASRTTAATTASRMGKQQRAAASTASLFQVLSAKPTRNAETTYTAIMSAGDAGHHRRIAVRLSCDGFTLYVSITYITA